MTSLNISALTPAELQALLDGPAATPPPGVIPDFVDPPNQTYLGIVTNVICLLATLIVVSLRAYAKIFCVKRVRIEDYLVLGALGTYIGCIYCDIWMMEVSGLFIHQWNVQLKTLPTILYTLHLGSNLTAITILLLKGAILLEWTHIFVPRGTRNSFYWTCAVVSLLHTLFHGSWIVTENLSCAPHAKIYNPLLRGHCIDVKGIYLPAAAVNLASDIVVLLLPQKAIWSLQMSRKSKIGVSLIFTIGFLACLAAIFRLYATVIFYRSDDEVYTGVTMYLLALAEMTCLFLVFCVPAIPKAFSPGGCGGGGRGGESRMNRLLKNKTWYGHHHHHHPHPHGWSSWSSSGKTATSRDDNEDDGESITEYSRRRRHAFYGYDGVPVALYRQYGANLSDILNKTPSVRSVNVNNVNDANVGYGPVGAVGVASTTRDAVVNVNPAVVNVNRGPVTEISADPRRQSSHHHHHHHNHHHHNHHQDVYQGVGGILCTTEFTAEVSRRSDEERDAAVVENAAYQQYQWSIMH